jgi:hypothetical protein
MNKNLNVALAVAVGFLAGALYQRTPLSVHAQAPAAAPKELRAQSFVFVDSQGVTVGTLSFDEPRSGTTRMDDPRLSRSRIRLVDPSGNEIWSAGGNPMRPLAAK